MQLIQIGEIKQKTVLDMIQEMAERQFAEIEQLKAAAQSRTRRRPSRRARCTPSPEAVPIAPLVVAVDQGSAAC
jgi:hypothetical protein